MRVVGRNVRKAASEACLERTRGDTVGMGAVLDRQRERSWRIEISQVAGSEEGVKTAGPRGDSTRMPEGMRMVTRTTSKKGKRRAERMHNVAEMDTGERNLSYVSRMAVLKKWSSVKWHLKKMKEDQ